MDRWIYKVLERSRIPTNIGWVASGAEGNAGLRGTFQVSLKCPVFGSSKTGVVRLENPGGDSLQGSGGRRKVLIHTPTNEVITSYAMLERKLSSLGWERYYDDPELLQFHKRSTVHLISLPKDFGKFKSMHMFDIVVKNRNIFEVRDM
ncbi:Flowering-promoting factor 1-like protein 3 [Vitis vinifera]|uniref:Flowering-promoting factor 1-like protein 3 n=1 Tax=Vitis vinifera TaxID=29760 RepID=A0A438KKS1_VITVI|nr:Flowering-promoting factor 1-like protein 3 [Vitis vinifera]